MIVQGIEERVFFSLTDTTGKIIKAGGFFDIYELKNFLADLPVGEQVRMFESIVVLARRAIEAGNKMMTVSGLNDPACHNEWNQAVAPFGGGFWQENGYEYYKTIEHFEIVIRQEIGALKQKVPEDLPELTALKKLTEGTSPVLREWPGGRYKCKSLERFIQQYQKLSDNLSPSLIRDYLICERSGEPYADDTIEQRIKEHRT